MMKDLQAWACLTLIAILGMAGYAGSSEYSITKVNHEFIDPKGNTTEEIGNFVARAQYQRRLEGSGQVQGMRFFVLWQAPSADIQNFTVRLELRGVDSSTGKPIRETLTKIYPQVPNWSSTTTLDVTGDTWKRLGKIMAWRVSLLQNSRLVAEKKSFTWDETFLKSQPSNTPKPTER